MFNFEKLDVWHKAIDFADWSGLKKSLN